MRGAGEGVGEDAEAGGVGWAHGEEAAAALEWGVDDEEEGDATGGGVGWAREGGCPRAGSASGHNRGKPLPDCVNCGDLATPKSTTLTLHWWVHWWNARRAAADACGACIWGAPLRLHAPVRFMPFSPCIACALLRRAALP